MQAKYPILSLLLLLCVTMAIEAQQIFRHVDEDGQVTFSDRPEDGGERVKLSPTNTTPAPAAAPAAASRDEEQVDDPTQRYSDVWIAQPQHDEAVRSNTGDVAISVRVDPQLLAGDRLRLLLNGSPAAADTPSGQFQLFNLDRGSHQLQPQVLDRNNDVVLTGEEITIHVLRTTVPRPTPHAGGG